MTIDDLVHELLTVRDKHGNLDLLTHDGNSYDFHGLGQVLVIGVGHESGDARMVQGYADVDWGDDPEHPALLLIGGW